MLMTVCSLLFGRQVAAAEVLKGVQQFCHCEVRMFIRVARHTRKSRLFFHPILLCQMIPSRHPIPDSRLVGSTLPIALGIEGLSKPDKREDWTSA